MRWQYNSLLQSIHVETDTETPFICAMIETVGPFNQTSDLSLSGFHLNSLAQQERQAPNTEIKKNALVLVDSVILFWHHVSTEGIIMSQMVSGNSSPALLFNPASNITRLSYVQREDSQPWIMSRSGSRPSDASWSKPVISNKHILSKYIAPRCTN